MNKTLSLGKAGELRVASELLLRNQDVYLTIVDYGIDLVLGNGKRIQVKSAHKLKTKYCNSYTFAFREWQHKNKKVKQVPNKFKNVDFIVLWAINDDLFLIIPADEIRGKYTIRFNPYNKFGKKSQYLKFIDKWELLY